MSSNLKIVRDDSVLHVVEKPRSLQLVCAMVGILIPANHLALNWTVAHPDSHLLVWPAIGLMASLVALVFRTRRDFQFDKAARKLVWRRGNLLWTRSGEVPFADISSVWVDMKITRFNMGRLPPHQLLLQTAQGELAVSELQIPRLLPESEVVVARIREVLNNPKS